MPLSPPPPVPFALLPPKKWWLWLSRTQADAAAAAPLPVGSTQIHATTACAAATDALALPAPAPALQADAAASSSPAAGQKRLSSTVPPLAGDQEPHAPPPPQPPASADGKPPSTLPPAKRVRKVVKKVRKVVKRLVPNGTTSASAAAGKETSNTNAAAAASAAAAGASPLQLLAAVAEEEHEPGEFIPETKPAGDCKNAAGAGGKCSPSEEETAVELQAKVAGQPPVVEKKLVVSSKKKKGAEKDGAVMRSGRRKRMTAEVFVGGLDRDATEEDVRAALAEAGEIAEVRMIRDAQTPAKNKGYCFVRYSEPAQARKAVAKFGDNVKICGKQCGVEAVERNDKVNTTAQGDPNEGYTQIYYGEKQPFSPLGDNSSYFMSHNSSAPNGSNAYATPISSYGTSPYAIVEYPPLYHHGSSLYLPDSYYYGPAEPWGRIPMRQAGSRKQGQPHGGRH